MPLSGNNKVDHNALRSLFGSASADSTEDGYGAEPESSGGDPQLDDHVVEVLSSFLGIPITSIKPESRLFQLGLDSINAIGLARRLTKEGYQNADVATVLRFSVVRELAQAIAQEPSSDRVQAVEAARKRIDIFADKYRKSDKPYIAQASTAD